MRNRESIIGKTFGRLTVISQEPSTPFKNGTRTWFRCICECGKAIVTQRYYLTCGDTQSCGCVRIKHGHCKNEATRTYRAWADMKQRCKPTFHQSRDYFERGISVCEKWANSFSDFLSDMGECPLGKSLDRIDNELGYFPGNCRWATESQQKRNTRRNRIVSYAGFTGCVSDACLHFNIPRDVVFTRLRRGWTIEESFSTPICK